MNTAVSTRPSPPKASTFLTGDAPDEIESCRSLADYLRAEGFVAILAPSAALAGERNLMIYLDRPPRRLDLEVGKERIRV